MSKFLVRARYTTEGLDGSVRDGFQKRERYLRRVVKQLGGRMEAWYWAFGDDDIVMIADMETESAIALSLAVTTAGIVSLSMMPLITGAEMDAARSKLPGYQGPGTRGRASA